MGGVGGEPAIFAQVRGQVVARPVHVAGRLQDEAAHRAVPAGAAGQQVEGADHVGLVRAPRIEVEGVDRGAGMHHGVDADRAHQLADQRMADVELQEIRTPKVVVRLAGVDADHLGHLGLGDQALHQQRSPPAGHAGDQDPPLAGHAPPSLSSGPLPERRRRNGFRS